MNEITIFNNARFGEVRTIVEKGNVLFCGVDVATALGYAKPQNAIAAHCKGALKRGTPFLCVNGYVLSGTTKATHHHGHATATTEASATLGTLWASTLATKQIQSVRYTEHYV
mgnify:CR=1 FL=1